MQVVKIRNLKKIYKTGEDQFTALDNINIDVDSREFLALTGPSGSGKTTLLNIIGCLDSPTEGEVFLGENKIEKLSSDRLAEIRKNRLGFIFQSFNLIPVLTAYENVEFPLTLNKVDPKIRGQRVREMLEKVGLGEKIDHFPHQMSGGQQQRVAIARALITDPMLVLADEPTANLDFKTGKEVISIMRKLNQEKGTTFIFATHDQRVIDQASRIIPLEDGKVGNK